MDRNIHYEAAFEAFLRDRGIPCVAVDEAKKALFANARLKSFDFVVYSKSGPNLLIDVKGRQLRDRSAVESRAGNVCLSRAMVPAPGNRPGGVPQAHAKAFRQVGNGFAPSAGI